MSSDGPGTNGTIGGRVPVDRAISAASSSAMRNAAGAFVTKILEAGPTSSPAPAPGARCRGSGTRPGERGIAVVLVMVGVCAAGGSEAAGGLADGIRGLDAPAHDARTTVRQSAADRARQPVLADG